MQRERSAQVQSAGMWGNWFNKIYDKAPPGLIPMLYHVYEGTMIVFYNYVQNTVLILPKRRVHGSCIWWKI